MRVDEGLYSPQEDWEPRNGDITRNPEIVFGDKRPAPAESAVEAPTAYPELTTTDRLFSTYCRPHLVVSDGHLPLKDRGGTIICFGIGQ